MDHDRVLLLRRCHRGHVGSRYHHIHHPDAQGSIDFCGFLGHHTYTLIFYRYVQNQQKLRNTVHGIDIIEVCRGSGVYETISTEELVPGDIIVLPANGCTMHCDAVLLFGTCIVNESMLTGKRGNFSTEFFFSNPCHSGPIEMLLVGESVPVTKTPLPVRHDIFYHPKEHSRHTLFSGTKVVQTRFYNEEKVEREICRL